MKTPIYFLSLLMLVSPVPDPEAEAQNIIVNNVINCFHSNCNQNNNNGRPQISGSNGNCPDWWTKSATGCYYFGEKFMTWRNSKTFCENFGGFLAEIQNPQQQIFMENMSRLKLSPRGLNVHEWNI